MKTQNEYKASTLSLVRANRHLKSKRADQVEAGDRIWHGSSIRTVTRANRDYLQNWAFTLDGNSKGDWCGWFRDEEQIPLA